ncbi:MAG TPA: TCR/Tet family MFS transporter [Bacteroidia bacterium]|jgi:DHA1 family tetracycline resistance protein-like MFS transporter|nr:TCR/Tet family MFS transporter [Bacteroidia bacterium]
MIQETNKKALLFIFITLLVDCTGIGIIIPVVPSLIQQLTGGNVSEAASYGGWLTFAYAIMQFVFSPVLGGLSDRFGRRPILLTSLFGLGVDYLFLFFAPTLWWLFVGRIIAGICGASFSTASAYIADISPPEKRAQNFGMIGAAFGLGFIIGPLLGSVFSQFGVRAPFLVAAALSLLNWLYGFFILPESLSKENRRAYDWKRANPLGSLLQLKKYPSILGLITATTLIYIAGHAAQSTWTYFTIEKFKWNEQWVGYSIAFVGVSIAVVQGGLIRPIMKALGQNKAVFVGLCLYVVGFTLFAFASRGWMMFAFMVPYALAGIAGPAIQGIVSSQVPANAQGELQGAMTSLMSVASIVGPILMTGLFSYFTAENAPIYFPGAPFMMGAVLTVFSVVIAAVALRKHH